MNSSVSSNIFVGSLTISHSFTVFQAYSSLFYLLSCINCFFVECLLVGALAPFIVPLLGFFSFLFSFFFFFFLFLSCFWSILCALGTRNNVMSITLVTGPFPFLSLFRFLRLGSLKVLSWPFSYGRSCLSNPRCLFPRSLKKTFQSSGYFTLSISSK